MLPITFKQAKALFVLLMLIATHLIAYDLGKKDVRSDWMKERAEIAQAHAQAIADARVKEQELNRKANDVQAKLNVEKKRAAAAAGAAADELRLLQEALAASAATSHPGSAPGADGASTGQLLLECARVHQGVAAEADGLANKVTGLQGYVANVCQSSPSGNK